MKRTTIYITLFLLGLLLFASCRTQEYTVRGPEGGIAFENARFDPKNPPEYIRCWGMYRLGREYLVTTQQLDIYGTAAAYGGPVFLLHGDRDGIVPMWCSERFLQTYGSAATLRVVEGENHTITRRRNEVIAHTVAFFRQVFGL